ncbi:MAG: protein LvrD [Legionellaceae bacterium]|nr:protein LvrD [Legionellaceae bacterium]
MKIYWKKMLGLATSIVLLSACHHDNPLETHSKKDSATFLENASSNVEVRLNFAIKKEEHGYGYGECMEGKKNPEINCTTLYEGMVRFAKEGHYAGFNSLTLADLTNKKMFASLIDDYYEIMITTWPTYYPVK